MRKRKCPSLSADQRFHAQGRLKAAAINIDDASVVSAGAPRAYAPTGAVCLPYGPNLRHKNIRRQLSFLASQILKLC
jgi:hypothetical protein